MPTIKISKKFLTKLISLSIHNSSSRHPSATLSPYYPIALRYHSIFMPTPLPYTRRYGHRHPLSSRPARAPLIIETARPLICCPARAVRASAILDAGDAEGLHCTHCRNPRELSGRAKLLSREESFSPCAARRVAVMWIMIVAPVLLARVSCGRSEFQRRGRRCGGSLRELYFLKKF